MASVKTSPAQALLDHVYKQFGIPDKMISDCGPQFAAESIRELLRLLGIQLSLSMLITLKATELQKGTTKRLKCTLQSTVYSTLRIGTRPYLLWNFPTIVDVTPIALRHLLN